MFYHKTFIKYKKNKINFYGRPNTYPHNKQYDFFIIIPAYSENDYIDQTLSSINQQNQTFFNQLLVVVVINNSLSDHDNIKENNLITYNRLIQSKYCFELIVIDSFSMECAYDAKLAGVGLARKIGMDFCISYSHYDSLYFSLDADTIIEPNYLTFIYEKYKKHSFKTAIVNFSHQPTNDKIINVAINKYELLLKQIAKKIQKTGSPYGYVSMGSTIICTALAYVSVGGIDPKKATEDFYFLQKLAKYDFIYQISQILVHPSSRQEQRVYLGTGYRLKNINNNPLFKDLQFSNQAFEDLQFIYDSINKHWDCSIFFIKSNFLEYNEKIWDYFIENNFENIFNKIQKNINTQEQLINQFNYWFDSLKIYKFLKMYI